MLRLLNHEPPSTPEESSSDDEYMESWSPRFLCYYRCYPISRFPGPERPELENGGKILLPASALEQLTYMNVPYPLLFCVSHNEQRRTTHCGVLEFIADETKAYIPSWMMRNLRITKEGTLVQVTILTLPVATFSKFQPQSADFMDISNPKAMLENALRHFSCLTIGDIIAIPYNGRVYELRVLETRPGSAVNIIECDMDVEFTLPVGCSESAAKPDAQAGTSGTAKNGSMAFTGRGYRLNGKEVPATPEMEKERGTEPDVNFRIGQLNFCRPMQISTKTEQKSDDKRFQPFSGEGTVLESDSAQP